MKKYKVMRVYRNSGRKDLIEKDLTEAEAQRKVKQYPDSKKTMVVYYEQ